MLDVIYFIIYSWFWAIFESNNFLYRTRNLLPHSEQIVWVGGYPLPQLLQNFTHFLLSLMPFVPKFSKSIDKVFAKLHTAKSSVTSVALHSLAKATIEISASESWVSPICFTTSLTVLNVLSLGWNIIILLFDIKLSKIERFLWMWEISAKTNPVVMHVILERKWNPW